MRGEIKDEAREGGRMGCEDGGGEEDKKQTLRHTVDVIYSVHASKFTCLISTSDLGQMCRAFL